MRITILAVISFLAFSFLSAAQKDEKKDYVKMKEAITEKVFGTPDPIFKDNTVPPEFKNESAVILAQKHSLESDSKNKLRISFFITSGVKYTFYDIFRRKILINDKAALDEYSEISFNKLQGQEKGWLGKLKNYTFINIRLIKPNNTVKTVDVDESAVTLKDEKNAKQNKIAIPGLSIGDIIDYYVCNYYQDEGDGSTTPLIYVLGDDYPILNYAISLQFDARISAEYQTINGAPDFKITPDEEGGGNVLSLNAKNLPKIKGLIWASNYRQLPIIRLNYKLGMITRRGMSNIKEGKVEKASSQYADKAEADMAAIMYGIYYEGAVGTRIYKKERSDLKSEWKDYLKKFPAADNPDSIAAFVFRYNNWLTYAGFQLTSDFNSKYYQYGIRSQLFRISLFSYIMMLEFKTDLEFLVIPGKESYTWDNAFSAGDLSVMVRTREPHPQYFSFADNFDFPNTIPSYLQGERARVFPVDTRQLLGGKLLIVKEKSSSTITLPSSDHKSNAETETIQVKTDPADPLLLNMKRKLTATGYLKKDGQATLTLFEDMAKVSSVGLGQEPDMVVRYTDRGKDEKKSVGELKTLLEKARTKNKEDFENEIERNYGVRAKELKSYKILNAGLTAEAPFEFEEEFVMEGWVKKAGNNYIVDIGKCIASQVAIEKDQRVRTKDIYMPFPRSFNYTIELAVPNGYTADGVDKLNSKTENETGGFSSSARLENNKVIIDIRKFYYNSFEPAANWPLLLSFLDKAIEFNQLKILFKKI